VLKKEERGKKKRKRGRVREQERRVVLPFGGPAGFLDMFIETLDFN
jgi:hypothetical protein